MIELGKLYLHLRIYLFSQKKSKEERNEDNRHSADVEGHKKIFKVSNPLK